MVPRTHITTAPSSHRPCPRPVHAALVPHPQESVPENLSPQILRSDEDRALHDHPWSFLSIILRGGYFEISETFEGKKTTLVRNGFAFMRTEEGRLTIQWPKNLSAYRPATYRHRVKLISFDETSQEVPCWTLIVTGPHVREWGFWCPRYRERRVDYGFGRFSLHSVRDGDRFVHWTQWGADGCGE